MSTVLVVTSAEAGLGVIPVYDVWLLQLQYIRLTSALLEEYYSAHRQAITYASWNCHEDIM